MVRDLREVSSGCSIYPVRKLHSSSSSLRDYPILKCRTKYTAVGGLCSVLLKNLYKGFVLVPVKQFGGRYGLAGLFPYVPIGDSGVE